MSSKKDNLGRDIYFPIFVGLGVGIGAIIGQIPLGVGIGALVGGIIDFVKNQKQ